MNKLNTNKTGLVLGTIVGGMHVMWSLLLLVGWAQPLVTFILWAHMVQIGYVLGPFDIKASVTLILVTAVVGYAVGFAFATFWNKLHVK